MIGDVPTDEQLFGALRAGAVGYLLRGTDPDRLAHALRGVASGEAPIPRSLVTRLIAEFRRGDLGRIPMTGPGGERLSARESDVLALLAQGASTRAAAVALGVSEVTVRRHVSGAVAKLGVPDRAAALAALRAAGGALGHVPRSRTICSTGGTSTTMNITGRIRNTSGKSSLTGVLAACSSAI